MADSDKAESSGPQSSSDQAARRVSRALVRQPLWWVSAAFALAALRCLTAPSTADAGKWVGAALVAGGAVLVMAGVSDRFALAIALGVASMVGGALLYVDQDAYRGPVARATMVVLIGAGVVAAVAVKRSGYNLWVAFVVLVVFAGSGWLFAEYPREMLTLGFGSLGLAAAVITAAGTAIATRRHGGRVRLREAWAAVGDEVVRRVSGTGGYHPEVQEAAEVLAASVFFEGDGRKNRLVRFYALMGFASALASLGVLSDSTAVVIGAMLVAPLMSPLMGISLAVVSGWRGRLLDNVVTVTVYGTALPDDTTTATLSDGVADLLGPVDIVLRVRLEQQMTVDSSDG